MARQNSVSTFARTLEDWSRDRGVVPLLNKGTNTLILHIKQCSATWPLSLT